MGSKLRIAGIFEESIVDGPGIRFVIYTQGCTHNCPNCHNPETHDPLKGELVDIKKLFAQIKENPLLKGVTFSGGEPFLQADVLYELGLLIKDIGLDLWVFTGFLYEDLLNLNIDARNLLSITDVLVDGPFIEAEKDLSLKFRGSKNQRILKLSFYNNELQVESYP
ncbi:MAG: anaerobic ribonucleoside-triphosphate reductase activating protein [Tissierellia bacterium]|nr:anaerobic ribonucleoside-triphosphate reductase activating protein [Tissierellia bacterium]